MIHDNKDGIMLSSRLWETKHEILTNILSRAIGDRKSIEANVFLTDQVIFLGGVVSFERVSIDPKKIRAIVECHVKHVIQPEN